MTLNQLHFPVGRPVVATLRSKDVIHSFFLPEFRVKQDAVPGMSTRIWFDAMRVGHWEIACAELCGLGHYRMKGFVTVETPEEFEKWLKEQAAQASPPAQPASAAAAAVRRGTEAHEHDHTGRLRGPGAGGRGRHRSTCRASIPRPPPSGASTSSRSTTR